jgi:hypothetical protein
VDDMSSKKRLYILENPIPNTPADDAEEEVRNKHQHRVDEDEQTTCVMLASISPKLQRQRENMDAYNIIMHLKKLFDEASRTKRYETFKELFYCKMTRGSLVNTHVLKMIDYIKKLSQLGFVMDHELTINLVLQSLPQNLS